MSREVIGSDKPWTKTIAFSLGVASDDKLLFTAGITARDPEGKVVGAGDMRAQIEQCFRNVGDVLRAAGADYGDVLKWTMYTTDIIAYGQHAEVWRRYFVNKPASTLIEVSRFVVPEMMVEIEAVARVPKAPA
jgi:enamine deaminase RidA (YjgF/YER057c/UK114 family)